MSTWTDASDESDELADSSPPPKDLTLRAPHAAPQPGETEDDWEDFDDEFDDDFDDALDQELEKELALKFADDGYGGLAGGDDILDDDLAIGIGADGDDEEPADVEEAEPVDDAE